MTKPTHWKTRDGRVIPITEMETEHIRNVVEMIRKVGAISVHEAALMFAAPPPHGERAYDAWEEELMNLKVSRYLDPLLIELRRREIKEQP